MVLDGETCRYCVHPKLQLHYHECRTQSESGGFGDCSPYDRDVERTNNHCAEYNKTAQSIDATMQFTHTMNASRHVDSAYRKLNNQVCAWAGGLGFL